MKQERVYGIDLLRIIATYMVLILHILGQGGILWTVDSSYPIYNWAWLLEILAFCAVNCYALISGYVGIYSKFRLSNLLLLWMQVVCISATSLIIFLSMGIEVTGRDWINACLPVSAETYWYFTAYFGMYFLTPFLNRFIHESSGRILGSLLLVLLFLFSFMPTVFRRDMFMIDNGYSVMWLVVLYIFGAVLRKYQDKIKIKKGILIAGYFISVILTMLSKKLIAFLKAVYEFSLYDEHILIRYNSPMMVLAAVCLLLLFSSLNVKRGLKGIKVIASFSFGVYIIHGEPFVWENIMSGRFTHYRELAPREFIGTVVMTAIGIYIICIIVELIRMYVFKLCRIPKLCKKIEEFFRKILIPLMLSCGKKLLMGGNRE